MEWASAAGQGIILLRGCPLRARLVQLGLMAQEAPLRAPAVRRIRTVSLGPPPAPPAPPTRGPPLALAVARQMWGTTILEAA